MHRVLQKPRFPAVTDGMTVTSAVNVTALRVSRNCLVKHITCHMRVREKTSVDHRDFGSPCDSFRPYPKVDAISTL